jgi:hypothetical protein
MEILSALWQEMKDVAMLLVPFLKALIGFAANVLEFIIYLLRQLIEMI